MKFMESIKHLVHKHWVTTYTLAFIVLSIGIFAATTLPHFANFGTGGNQNDASVAIITGGIIISALSLLALRLAYRTQSINALIETQSQNLKQQYKTIDQQYRLIHTMLETAPLGFLICDPIDDVIQFCNAKYFEIFNIQDPFEERRKGITLSMEKYQQLLLVNLLQPELYQKNARYLRNPENQDRVDGTISFKDGRVVRCLSQQIRDSENNYLGRIYIYDDITKDIYTRHRLEAALEDAKMAIETKKEFLRNMSHEIRTPMNSILGMASLLESSGLNNDQQNHLRVLRKSGNALLDLIGEILDFNDQKRTIKPLKVSPFSPIEVIERSIKTVLSNTTKQLKIYFSCQKSIPQFVSGDVERFEKITHNLIANALKFTDKGYVNIGLTLENIEDDILTMMLIVEDTGTGIEKEKLNTIFDAFTQADGSHTREHGGTGIGLALTHQLVTNMGGKIKVDSEINRGSKFTVSLPFIFDINANQSRQMLPKQKAFYLGKNEQQLHYLRQNLNRLGINLSVSNNSDSLLKEAADIENPEATTVFFESLALLTPQALKQIALLNATFISFAAVDSNAEVKCKTLFPAIPSALESMFQAPNHQDATANKPHHKAN